MIGVDGSAAMIELARQRQAHESGSGGRVRFIETLIPGTPLPAGPYAAIISNSLLHHLHRPAVLWETIAAYASAGTRIYIADLRRPPTTAVARRMVVVLRRR